MSDETNAPPTRRISTRLVIGTFVGVLTLWLLTPLIVTYIVGPAIPDKGQFGDLYGSINSLFSGLAFAGVIIAIFYQREELALQRRELEFTRLELRRSADAQSASQEALNQTLYAQTFKMAIEILENPDVVHARGLVVKHGQKYDWQARKYTGEGLEAAAEKVSRTFETIGALVRQNLLPEKYIIETWSHPIARSWDQLVQFHMDLREDRADPNIGRDFEYLADRSKDHLRANNQWYRLPN